MVSCFFVLLIYAIEKGFVLAGCSVVRAWIQFWPRACASIAGWI